MERVQQALDKAREQRQGVIGSQADMRHSSTDFGGSVASRDDHSEFTRISYTQTQKVELSDVVLRDNRIIAGFEQDQRVEAYRQLRSQVLRKMGSENWHTLAITSPGENAGKTLTAINLAISLSRDVNQTVLLVDLDLKKPGIHNMLGVDVEFGIVDYLEGRVNLEDLLFNPGVERLVVLPGTPQGNYASEVLSSPQMHSLMRELEQRYESRIIIFDLPPLLRNDDALILTAKVDANLLVVEEGVSTPDDIHKCLHLLEGSHLLGTILNKAA